MIFESRLVVGQLFPDPMHVSRGGWLGQTFALAKFDDSFEGKKTGVRRSKEERKGMVETFIKRYQKLNNGDFPSLNLTRKEVGGSFYTVREIVREIIQENRVLGPPKSSPEDTNTENLDTFLEHHPLGSISVDHHVHMVPPIDAQTPKEQKNQETELESLEKPKNTELLVEGGIEEHADEILANRTKKHQVLEDIEVGTSSLGPVITSTIRNLDEKLKEIEIEVLDGGLEEKGTENRKLATEKNKHIVCNEMQLSDKSTDVVDMESNEEITHPLSESKPPLESQKAQNVLLTKENAVLHVNDNTDVKLEGNLPSEEKIINGANGHNLHSKTSSISVQELILEERSENLNKSSDQPGGNPQKRTTATLNRINLESWEAASKKSSGRETSHQLVTFIKAFITAFVKFWS